MAEEESGSQQVQQPPGIDLEELARILYELLKHELLLENERTGR